MIKPELNLEDFMKAAMAAGMPSVDLHSLVITHPSLVRDFASYDPFRLAALFGGLLTVPELQSNCIRLEALCHLALVCAHGARKPNAKIMTKSFMALGNGPVGLMEDPAEDVFVTSVATKQGNFRVLEGIWESAGFFLQRFVNIIDTMPGGPGYDDIRAPVYALLKLSDVVCARAKLVRWQMGAPDPIERLPPGMAHLLRDLRARVTFTEDDLTALDIALDPLTEFVFRPKDRTALAGETIGHTHLERYPVLWRNTDLCLALPTGVSAAIRRFILDRLDQSGTRENFLKALGQEYATTLSGIPLLGAMPGPIRFQRTKGGAAAAVATRVDTGRYLAFIFILDNLDDVETTGIAGLNDGFHSIGTEIAALAKNAADAAQENADFRDGVTLFVSCGIGRGAVAALPEAPEPHWRQEFLSIADLVTLSWTKDCSPLRLWRLLDAQDQIEREGVYLQNVNGLLNLVAWQRSLHGNLVPHNHIPDDFVSEDGEALLMIEQAGIKSLRREVAETWDPHVAQDITGAWIAIRKVGGSSFDEDTALPLYAGAALSGNACPPVVYLAPNRRFWCELILSENTTLPMAHERWKMMNVWLARLAGVLDARLSGLPVGPLLWRVEFEADLHPCSDPPPSIGLDEAKRAIAVRVDRSAQTVILHVAKAYEAAHFNIENIAERALVERTVEGFLDLAGAKPSDDELALLMDAIIPDVHARQTHAFRSRSFRDHVRQNRSGSVVFIDEDDDAALRLGLGWRVRDRKDGCDLYGKSDCTAFLNAVTRILEDELSADLVEYNRATMIEVLLRNHERAAINRDQWSRTSSAVVALRDDKAAAFKTIAQHEGRLNAVFQSSRTLVEVAQCACPEDSGRKPGKLDLSRLMAKMSFIIHLGGWSGAMWHDAMEARIHINSLGDIQVNHSFMDTVIEPFGRTASEERTKDAISSYADHLADRSPCKSVEAIFEPEFLDAFRDEFGTGLDDVWLFIDFIEDLGIKQGTLVLTLRKSALLAPMVGEDSLPPETAAAIIQALTLPRRENWRAVPNGYDDKDRQPWRYRRRLSILRKPLVQLDDKPDPTILVAPGLLRDGVHYALINYHRGDFPQWQLAPKMRSWRGKISDKRGTEFNTEVAERLRSLGWNARADVNMSAILGSAYRALGDIDVLTWNPLTGRVLVIECKDVKFSKTMGEIAEQLADFRGELHADGKPDDLLRHLNRMEAIRAHLPELSKYLRLGAARAAEGHIVFRNPVPMQFAWEQLKARIGLHLFEWLAEI